MVGWDPVGDAIASMLGMSTEDLYAKTKFYFADVPFVGSVVRAFDQSNYYSDYMRNRGLSWSDVQYPSLMRGSGGVGSGLNFVSSNIERLYR